MFIAVRSDMPPGLQMAQVSHASFAFYRAFPQLTLDWLRESNYLVVVAVPHEDALLDLITEVTTAGLVRCAVREPDLENQATAVAIQPGPEARRICARLPLALRDTKEMVSVPP